MTLQKKHSNLIAWTIVIAFFLVWEMFVRCMNIPPYLLPAPTLIFETLMAHPDMYLSASVFTLGEAMSGLILGLIGGFLIACLLTLQPGFEDGVMTLAILIKSTPLVAIAPLLTLWLGFGIVPKIIITALLTFFPVLVNVLSGLQKPDRSLLDLFHSWNANRQEIFFYLRIPSAMPYLFAALKISAPLALIGAVVAEWTGASGGLGRIMWLAYSNLNLPFLFGAIMILAASGMILYRLLVWEENVLVFWQNPQ